LDNIETFDCEYCSRQFTERNKLKKHVANCEPKPIVERLQSDNADLRTEVKVKDATIAELKDQVARLDIRLAELIKSQERVTLTAITRPTTSVRQTIKNLQVNNLTPLLAEEMRSHIPMLTHAHIEAGAAGLAQYAVEYPLRDKVLVADVSRRKLKWKNEEGIIVEDLEGMELCKKFFEVHKEESRKKIQELMKEVRDVHDQAIDEGDEETIRICDERICKLHELRKGIAWIIQGQKHGLQGDFVREVVKLTPGGPSEAQAV
jgi:hypothetical protein